VLLELELDVRLSSNEYDSSSLTSVLVASIPQETSDPSPLENSLEKSILIVSTVAPGVDHFKAGTANTYALEDPAFLGIFVNASCKVVEIVLELARTIFGPV
jgi:hypothetical protein